MAKVKIKKGDRVIVISGAYKGKQGMVLRILPNKNKALVEGINIVKKHKKPSTENPQGKIVEEESFIDISNVALIDPEHKTATKVGYRFENGVKVRFAKKSNKPI